MNQRPSVTLAVVNRDGERHLPDCLDSIRALDYPADRLETIVVDNGSTDGSLALLRERYPWARVLPQERNVGFAEGVNVAARASSAELLALANNDMRLDPSWLTELVAAYDPDDGCPCVAGLILDWDGERIDFAEGWVNFHGAAGQARWGDSVADVEIEDARRLPFACGGSMLVERALFLELGGFDPAFFAYLEDVDFGWRLRLAGHDVRLASRARSFHRAHGTASAFPPWQRDLLLERNALLMLLKNLDVHNLRRLLAPALLLLVERALVQTGSDRAAFDAGATPASATEAVPRVALAPLHAVADVVRDLAAVLERRRHVQSLRRRSDAEIFAAFGRPFAVTRTEERYLETAAGVTRAFGLEELFAKRPATRLLVVSGDDSRRLWAVARAAARAVPVTFAARRPPRPAGGIEVIRAAEAEALTELVDEADVVLLDAAAAAAADVAKRAHGVLVVDTNGRIPDELLEIADVLAFASEADRDAFAGRGRAVRTLVLPERGALDSLRSVLAEPWRYRSEQRAPAATEDARQLLAHWRREYGVSRGPAWHLGRALWRALPETARRPVRALRGRR